MDFRWIMSSGGVRRLDSYDNAADDVYLEAGNPPQSAGDNVFSNSLMRDGGWDAPAYNTLQPAGLAVDRVAGDATHKMIMKDCVIEVRDHPDVGPVNGFRVGTTSASPDSAYNEVTNNRIVYKGAVSGVVGSGFMAFSGTSAAETTTMKDNAVINNNAYHHTGPSTDKVFESDTDGSTHTTMTFATWQDEGWDAASSSAFDETKGSQDLVDWQKGDMPTWAAIKDVATISA